MCDISVNQRAEVKVYRNYTPEERESSMQLFSELTEVPEQFPLMHM